MGYLDLNASFAKMRLNVGASGVRHAAGDAKPSLALGREWTHHDDHNRIASLRCSWELVPIDERFLPPELVEIAREEPEFTHSLVQLYSKQLMVFVAMDVRGFDHFWRVLGNHLGNDNIQMSIAVSLHDYYLFPAKEEKSLKTDLLAGVRLVSGASVGICSRDFDPYVPHNA